jgi:hypothetical protein
VAFRNPIRRLSQLQADELVGALIRTATSGARLEIGGGFPTQMKFFTGDADETENGWAKVVNMGFRGLLQLAAPDFGSTGQYANINIYGQASGLNTLIELLATGVLIGKGRAVGGLDFGTTGTLTTNASGEVFIAHNLGVVPAAVSLTKADLPNRSRAVRYKSGSTTSSQICATVLDSAGAIVGSGETVAVSWTALV